MRFRPIVSARLHLFKQMDDALDARAGVQQVPGSYVVAKACSGIYGLANGVTERPKIVVGAAHGATFRRLSARRRP